MEEAGSSNNAIEFTFRLHKHGVKIRTKVWPEVEEFFQHWSGGLHVRPESGRLWSPVPMSDPNFPAEMRLVSGPPIVLWAMGPQNLGPNSQRPFTLLHSGIGFTEPNHGWPNISFLRLVGASQPEGREVIVEAVMGRGELARTAQQLSEASNLFYAEYLQPVNYRAYVGVERVITVPSAA